MGRNRFFLGYRLYTLEFDPMFSVMSLSTSSFQVVLFV